MNYNNNRRGPKFLESVNTRFSEMVIRAQLKALLKQDHLVNLELYFSSIRNWFEALPGPAPLKQRYKDDVPAHFFWDGKPKRILLSKFKDHGNQDFFAIGMNYGVLIGKTIVVALNGHDCVCRLLAREGLIGVWRAVQGLTESQRALLGNEIDLLQQSIQMEQREEV